MTRDDSAREASSARIAYEARPWLKHYPSYIQPEITPRFASGLEMFLETVKNTPEQRAIYYFEQSMSYSQLDRASTALAACCKPARLSLHLAACSLILRSVTSRPT